MIKDKLSIAILGSRGIPNRYGGYEACAQELGIRLVEQGHEVSVYCGSDHPEKAKWWHGIRRIMIMNPEKSMGTVGQFIYDLKCNLHSRRKNFDIVLHLGYTSDSIWHWLWTKKSIHLVNMDGQEWKRSKYSQAVRRFLKYAEKLATKTSKYLVADSHPIEKYLAEKYKNPICYIAYGADIPQLISPDVPGSYSLESKQYDLIIARMEPENNIEMAIEAKLLSKDKIPLVIIGNANRYKNQLIKKYGQEHALKFVDAVYESGLVNNLRYHCRFYIHGHSVGGTNPSLLEAMACGCIILAHKNPFNKSVLGEDAFYYDSKKELSTAFLKPFSEHYSKWVSNNLEKIHNEFNWDNITNQYEKLFFDALDS
jgi:glycosyltransferase involved in cell wall biosynthesis